MEIKNENPHRCHVDVNEKPILFSTPMVEALLNGTKTVTRRVVKYPTKEAEPVNPYGTIGDELWVRETFRVISWDFEDGTFMVEYRDGDQVEQDMSDNVDFMVRYVDRLEKIGVIKYPDYFDPEKDDFENMQYKFVKPFPWKPSIYMPKIASRIQLKITNNLIESLQDISEEDAIAEGIQSDLIGDGLWKNYLPGGFKYLNNPKESFVTLWDSINGKPRKDGTVINWESDPLVWAVSFEVLE